MSAFIHTKTTYVVSAAVPIIVVGVLMYKVGWLGRQMSYIVLMQFLPFVLTAILAWLVRRTCDLSWVVLCGTLLTAAYALLGLYNGFWRVPAKGAADVIYRPVDQTAFVVITAVLVLSAVLMRRMIQRRRV